MVTFYNLHHLISLTISSISFLLSINHHLSFQPTSCFSKHTMDFCFSWFSSNSHVSFGYFLIWDGRWNDGWWWWMKWLMVDDSWCEMWWYERWLVGEWDRFCSSATISLQSTIYLHIKISTKTTQIHLKEGELLAYEQKEEVWKWLMKF